MNTVRRYLAWVMLIAFFLAISPFFVLANCANWMADSLVLPMLDSLERIARDK